MIRAAVLGGGVRGREHAAALQAVEGIALVGIVEPDPLIRRLASPSSPAVAGLRDLPAPDGIDYLVVATPPADRSAIVADALASTGARAVLAEKPLALDVGAARQVVDTCADAGVLLATGFHWRTSAAFQQVFDAVRTGALGRLERVEASCFGNLFDQGSHVVDAVRWITAAEVEWVSATAEDDPVALSVRLPADIGWYSDPAHPAPAWVAAELGLTDRVTAAIGAGILHPRIDPGVDDWRHARVAVYGTEGDAEAWASGRWRVSTSRGEGRGGDDPAGWMRPTINMHAAVCSAFRDGGAPPATGEDGVAAVEAVVACLQSASDGAKVTLPLANGHPPAPTLPARTVGSVSVVINLDDDRGFAPEAIASWRRGQQFDGDLELVLASHGRRPDLDHELRALLAPPDRYLVVDGASRMALWAAGVEVARGEVVVITEAHCAAEPGCLDALLEALADPRIGGAAGRAVPEVPTRFARHDAAVFEQGSATYASPSDWRKVVPHAFAIRRSTYHGLGGFETDLDLYAEQRLGAAMRRAGLPVVTVHAARVRHRFAAGPDQAIPTATGLARGQAIARSRAAPDDIEQLLYPGGGLPPTDLSRRIAAAALAGAVRARRPAAQWGQLVPSAIAPRRLTRAADLARLQLARLRCLASPSGPRLERAYLDLDDTATRLARRRVLLEHGPPIRPGLDAAGSWSSVDLEAGRLSRAHPPEVWQGQTFRWLEPFAVLVTDLPQGRWRLRLDTGGFGRDPRDAGIRIHLGGRPLPDGAIVVDERSVVIQVPPARLRRGRAQTWTIATDELRGVADERRLGLPLVAVEVEPG